MLDFMLTATDLFPLCLFQRYSVNAVYFYDTSHIISWHRSLRRTLVLLVLSFQNIN